MKKKWQKITSGFVVQCYVDDKCIGQEFVCDDDAEPEIEDNIGDSIDEPEDAEPFPLDMVQP